MKEGGEEEEEEERETGPIAVALAKDGSWCSTCSAPMAT